MTEEEHIARAMLLGRIYIEWAGVYVDKEEWRSSQMGHSSNTSWIDADTLAEVPQEEKLGRLVRSSASLDDDYADTYQYVFERMVR